MVVNTQSWERLIIRSGSQNADLQNAFANTFLSLFISLSLVIQLLQNVAGEQDLYSRREMPLI